ncbi:MAG: molybdenum ABC transporter ATP-binding protein [Caulobacteraceae bacterium]
MLEIEVRARLGDFRLDARFQGAADGVTVLFGPSGAGKSSVLAAVAGALRPEAGRIALSGEALFDSARGVDLPMERRRVGWVFQDARLFPHLSVEGNLRFGLKRAPGRGVAGPIRFDEVVDALGIGHLLHRRPRDLSGGERQRVGLGRALLSQPRLLLMDEPLASLDAPRRAEILPFLERVRGFGVPILYVSHSLAEAVRLGDCMAVMRDGRVIAEGPLSDVVSRPELMLAGSHARDGAALDGVVQGHDHRLTLVRAGPWDIRTPRFEAEVGAPVRLFILARDVMLALEPPRRISARNVLQGRVAALDAQDGRVLVRLENEAAVLLSALTPDAVEDLGLRPGMTVWAVVKSVAVDGLGGGLLEALEG